MKKFILLICFILMFVLPVFADQEIKEAYNEYAGIIGTCGPNLREQYKDKTFTITNFKTGKTITHTSKYIQGEWHNFDENGKEIAKTPDKINIKVIYDHKNKKHYSIIEKNGRTYIQDGQYATGYTP